MLHQNQRTARNQARRMLLPAWILVFCSFACADLAQSQQTGPTAYMQSDTLCGIVDLTNGQVTLLGTNEFGHGLAEINGTLYTTDDNTNLYSLSPIDCSPTMVGTGAVAVYKIGSTASGLYGLDISTLNLYSINPTTGATTLLGPTGLTTVNRGIGMSTGSATLYMAVGDLSLSGQPNMLYSVNTTTGAATLIGPTGIGGIDAMVLENGVLYAASADPPYSIYTLDTSTGTGTPGAPTPYQITGLAPAGLIPTPLSLTFPARNVGTTSPEKAVTVANVSPASITISNIATTGDFGSPSNTCESTLAPGDKCRIKVAFTPTQPGKRTGGLIVTDDAPGSPQTVALTGTGLGPGAKLTPKTLNFGTQPVGTDSQPQTVTLTNTGNETLNIEGIASTPPFSQSNTCGVTLAAKASCTIFVTFDPSSKGAQTGTLSVTDDAPGSPQMVNLRGTGTVK